MRSPSKAPSNGLQKSVLDFLQSHMRVTREDVRRACAGSNNSINVYLDQLHADKVLQACGRDGRMTLYTVHDDQDIAEITARRRASPEGAIWRSMRILREFCPSDIEASLFGADTGIELKKIQTYCSLLVRAGYLRVLRKAGKVRPARYRLVRDTGPLPPQEKRLPVVVDGNQDRIVFARGERL